MMGSIHCVGKTARWITPKEILDKLGRFDLDPCADIEQPWSTAWDMWTIKGLERKWDGRVWLNPPYGRETVKWLRKMAAHNYGTALVFARTDTRMFHEYVFPVASGLLFVKGRPHFFHPDGTPARSNSGGPLMLISYGIEDAEILSESGLGFFIPSQTYLERTYKTRKVKAFYLDS
jgi:hypothetical protein